MSTLLVLNKVRAFLSDIFGTEIHFLCYERVVETLCQKLVQTVCRLCYLQQELYSSKWTSAQQYQRDSTRTSWRKLWTDSRSIGHYRKNTRLRVNVNILRRWRLLIRWTADVQAASTWSPATTRHRPTLDSLISVKKHNSMLSSDTHSPSINPSQLM